MRRALLILVVLILLASTANLLMALRALTPIPGGPTTTVLNVFGPQAAALGWPVEPPTAWPEVTQYQWTGTFARRERQAWSAHGPGATTTHQMDVRETGWPMPVLRRVRLWWPWDDPAYSTTVPADSGVRIVWTGVMVNPLLVAGAVWVLAVLPWPAAAALRRRRRRLAGRCVACGYVLVGAATCAECGRRNDSGRTALDDAAPSPG